MILEHFKTLKSLALPFVHVLPFGTFLIPQSTSTFLDSVIVSEHQRDGSAQGLQHSLNSFHS